MIRQGFIVSVILLVLFVVTAFLVTKALYDQSAALETKVATLENQAADTQKVATNLKGELDSVEKKLKTSDTNVNKLTGDLEITQKRLEELNKKVGTTVPAQLEDLKKRVDLAEPKIAQLKQDLPKLEQDLRKLDPLVARAWVYYRPGEGGKKQPAIHQAVNAKVQPRKGPNGIYFTVTFVEPFADNQYAAIGSSTAGYVSFSTNTPKSIDVYIHGLVDGKWTQGTGEFSIVVFAK